jgi:hypothetical protein
VVKAILVAGLAALCVAASSSAEAAQPQVMIIGDSVATGMLWHPSAIAVLQKGLDVDWEVAVCRTLTDPGCPFDGERPPSLVDVVDTLGSVPPIVLVEVGYNDPLPTFASAVDSAMTALVAAGAQHVLWATLREAHEPFPELNAVLRAATARWPQLELVDWNAASLGENGWFQTDGEHLLEPGGIALAHLLHGAVFSLIDPLRIVSAPLRLRAGRSYSTRLRAAGGVAPYRWKVVRGRPPRGFHLGTNGTVTARLPGAAHSTFMLEVTDADGVTATVRASAG